MLARRVEIWSWKLSRMMKSLASESLVSFLSLEPLLARKNLGSPEPGISPGYPNSALARRHYPHGLDG
jgi:hypothetical protein